MNEKPKEVFKSKENDPDTITGFKNPQMCLESDVYVIPEGVTAIAAYAFDSTAAKAFVLPDSLKEIGVCAFRNLHGMKMIFIPSGVGKIGENAFELSNFLTIYCEDEPREGWYEAPTTYREDEICTPDDYAFDFHRGGVSYTRVTVKEVHSWNTEERPVVTHCTREQFMKILSEEGLKGV